MDLAKLKDFAKSKVNLPNYLNYANLTNPTLISKDIQQGFPYHEIKLFNEYDRWREVAKTFRLSREASLRLERIIYCCNGYDAAQTARHFGISRKTFYKWSGQFDRETFTACID